MTKVAFIGAGRIGATSAFASIVQTPIDELVFVDIVKDLAQGEAMDLAAAAAALGRKTLCEGGDDYALIKGADLCVVSAGLARKPGMTRLDLLEKNVGILRDICKKIKQHAPESIFLLVTNPVDVLLYNAYKELGFPRGRVVGMSSLHDSARLNGILLEEGVEKPDAYILGEHGETMFPVPSMSQGQGIDGVDWNQLEEKVRQRAIQVIERKGATVYAPAACVGRMVEAILEDTGEEIPSCCILDGEYGHRDVSFGVPAKLGRKGVLKIVEHDLSDDEKAKMTRSAETIAGKIQESAKM